MLYASASYACMQRRSAGIRPLYDFLNVCGYFFGKWALFRGTLPLCSLFIYLSRCKKYVMKSEDIFSTFRDVLVIWRNQGSGINTITDIWIYHPIGKLEVAIFTSAHYVIMPPSSGSRHLRDLLVILFVSIQCLKIFLMLLF